jgi:pSer/pThr/pTyr-binding forkhead associated (FHA) protein
MATLLVTEGPGKDTKFAIGHHRLVMVGRDPRCTFQIVDPELSRNHLQIKYDELADRHFAIDFNSKNGVHVNGSKIDTEMLLNDGDRISIGATTIVYCRDDTLSALPPNAYKDMRIEGFDQTRTC